MRVESWPVAGEGTKNSGSNPRGGWLTLEGVPFFVVVRLAVLIHSLPKFCFPVPITCFENVIVCCTLLLTRGLHVSSELSFTHPFILD